MSRSMPGVLLGVLLVSLPDLAAAQAKSYLLESANGLRLHNVVAEPVTHKGKKGLRVSADMTRLGGRVADGPAEPQLLAIIEGLTFNDGTIEAEIAGAPAPGAFEGARGFVGIAFRLQGDNKTYDAIYLRPTNGRAEDQQRRNRSVQYISHPDWPWSRLRQETPGKYESYVDLVPDEWTRIRIDVRGRSARLYVHDGSQPTLVVSDVKSGVERAGAVALWIGPGTVAHFRNVRVTNDSPK